MPAIGSLLVLAGLALAGRSALLLVGRGRPRRGETPAFVIAGPYRRVRNPILLGFILVGVGVALHDGSVLDWLAVAMLALGAHLWVVLAEEGRLRERFGRAYDAYLREVPRWLPRWRSG